MSCIPKTTHICCDVGKKIRIQEDYENAMEMGPGILREVHEIYYFSQKTCDHSHAHGISTASMNIFTSEFP